MRNSHHDSDALKQILTKNQNHPKIKETLKLICQARQKINYHALVSSNETYLQVRGLATHDYDEFNYINQLMHQKIIGVVGKIKREQLHVRDHRRQEIELKEIQQNKNNQVNEEIIAEIEHVVNNIDLPISLFKRNDQYWYPENPKTIQAKNYVHERIKEEHGRKKALRKQELKKKQEREKKFMEQMEKQKKFDEQRKQKMKANIQKTIEERKKAEADRKKLIQQSQKFGSSLKPVYKKIAQEQSQNKVGALEEHKRRLSDLRKLHQSVDLIQLKERTKRIEEHAKNRQIKTIINDPLKVYKSKYHTSMTHRSRVSDDQYQSLYDRKKQYSEVIRKQHKPEINQKLVQQMQERLKQMKRRRTRKNPKKNIKIKGDSDDEDDDDSQDDVQQSKTKQSLIKKNYLDDSDELDSDDSNYVPPKKVRVKGQDQDFDRQQRYQIGMQYLQYVRNLPKKSKQQQNNAKLLAERQQQQKRNRYDNQEGGHKSHYKDYLRQFIKPLDRNTIDHIDTSRIHNENTKSILGTDYIRKHKIQNQTRTVEMKVKNQEELLKVKKMGNGQAIKKRVQIDNAMVETIKARLSMMG